MKIKKIVISLFTVLSLITPITSFAEGMITFSGNVNIRDVGKIVSVMTLKPGADVDSPSFDDIGYVNQVTVDEQGIFSISIPANQLINGYDVLSNTTLGKKLYVSESEGSDDNSGDINSPFKTLTKAISLADYNTTICLKDMVIVPKNAVYESSVKGVTITGFNEATGDVVGGLDLSSTVSVQFRMACKLENMKINSLATESISENANKLFACGYDFVLGEGLTMTNPVDVFGGTPINRSCEGTNLSIYSGDYRRIYGGGENAVVDGDTHIKIYGMNEKYSANDDSKNYYDSRIIGGGRNSGADVSGNTYIEFSGGVAAYIVGCGVSSNVSGESNITVSGGRIMNVYGGTVDGTTVHNNNSSIILTGGAVESLFGGSKDCGFNGNTYIQASDAEVYRRIYGGCYNDYGFGWSSSYTVNGTTFVSVGKNLKVATGGDLSSDNKLNSGIFAGSRVKSNSETEVSVLLFADGSAESLEGMVGEKSGSYTSTFKSHHDYIVKADEGGQVLSNGSNNIKIITKPGKKAVIDNKQITSNIYSLTSDTTIINFENGITIDGAKPLWASNKLTVNADVTIGDMDIIRENDRIIAALYDMDGKMKCVRFSEIDNSGSYKFELGDVNANNTMYVRLYAWDVNTLKPLTPAFLLNLK